MTKRIHTPIYVVCAIAGALNLASDTGSNVQYVYTQAGTFMDSTIAGVVTVSIGTALALTAAFAAFRERNIITGILLVLGFFIGAVFSLTATADRTNNQRLSALKVVWDADAQHTSLFEDWRLRRRLADKECSPEKGGRGPQCGMAEDRASEARKELEARRLELDVTAQAIHTYVPIISVEVASHLAPMSLPVALFLLANALLAFGLGGKLVRPEFDVGLTGRAADEDKARRYVSAFRSQHGRAPNVIELRRAVGVSDGIARKAIRSRRRAA